MSINAYTVQNVNFFYVVKITDKINHVSMQLLIIETLTFIL